MTMSSQVEGGGPAPKVWLDLDQAALDTAYDQLPYAPNFPQITARMDANSALARERLGDPQAFAYGPAPIQKLYYFAPDRPAAPIHVHVHGGAWRQRLVKGLHFPAEAFNAAGIGFAIFDFTSVDETNGDLRPMLDQVCGALAWLAKNAARLGGDPERLYLSGFSSGAHLASMAMISDWDRHGLAANPCRGAVLAGGMYDLRPVRLSFRSRYVSFTDEIEHSLSPQRHLERFTTPVVLIHGTCETPEFQRQTRDFAAALGRAGKAVEYIAAEGYNHFEVMETLGNPCGVMGRAAIAQVLRGG